MTEQRTIYIRTHSAPFCWR